MNNLVNKPNAVNTKFVQRSFFSSNLWTERCSEQDSNLQRQIGTCF